MRPIGIIEGRGTGGEVAAIFREAVRSIAGEVPFLSFRERFGYSPNTYSSSGRGYDARREARDIERFFRDCRTRTAGVFRTAVNAETLYIVRRRVRKLKLVVLPVGPSRLLFIRDHLQGYYANETASCGRGRIRASIGYTEKNFRVLAGFVKDAVSSRRFKDYDLLFIYKFHLFGLELQRMIREAVRRSGLAVPGALRILQPDTALHTLLGGPLKRDAVVVAGNEIGDVLLETLLHHHRLGTKETFYNLNVAFVDRKRRLETLQTMHGSADDIAGKGLLNPIATLRAAAYASEKWLGVSRARERMERAIRGAVRAGFVTRDMGGRRTTSRVTGFVLSRWA
ncbi:MAG: isocitrate/isopropylmalate family dehydrogenase [Elusimicrobiota bacterium]